MTKEALTSLAMEAMQRAYAPYSGCKVGAALLSESGKVYLGCNIENASFSPTICAERSAFASAVSAGERRFSALAVCGGKDGKLQNAFYLSPFRVLHGRSHPKFLGRGNNLPTYR